MYPSNTAMADLHRPIDLSRQVLIALLRLRFFTDLVRPYLDYLIARDRRPLD